jgi:2-polyprenyl-6-methoxyphenol hydroxylase-like FAD-dependent oxidoreductase
MSNRRHVAIIGAGFGGLGVAEQLDHVPVEVTLIDRHNYHTFQPLLYQVATSLLNAEDVGAPVRGMFRHQDNVTFRMATVTGLMCRVVGSNSRTATSFEAANGMLMFGVSTAMLFAVIQRLIQIRLSESSRALST